MRSAAIKHPELLLEVAWLPNTLRGSPPVWRPAGARRFQHSRLVHLKYQQVRPAHGLVVAFPGTGLFNAWT